MRHQVYVLFHSRMSSNYISESIINRREQQSCLKSCWDFRCFLKSLLKSQTDQRNLSEEFFFAILITPTTNSLDNLNDFYEYIVPFYTNDLVLSVLWAKYIGKVFRESHPRCTTRIFKALTNQRTVINGSTFPTNNFFIRYISRRASIAWIRLVSVSFPHDDHVKITIRTYDPKKIETRRRAR